MGPCILPEGHFPRDRYREGKNPFYSLLFIKRDIWGDYIRVFRVILWNKPQSSIQLVIDDRWGTEIREAYFSFQVSFSESFRKQGFQVPLTIDWAGWVVVSLSNAQNFSFRKLSHHTYPKYQMLDWSSLLTMLGSIALLSPHFCLIYRRKKDTFCSSEVFSRVSRSTGDFHRSLFGASSTTRLQTSFQSSESCPKPGLLQPW